MRYSRKFLFVLASLFIMLPFQNFTGSEVFKKQSIKNIEVYKNHFKNLKKDFSPWSVAKHLNNILTTYKINHDPEYLRLLIDQAYELSLLTSEETGVQDSYTNKTAPALLSSRYSCGKPIALLVHHAVIWTPAVEAIGYYEQKHWRHEELPQISRKMMSILRVAMLGLNYFGKDVVSTDSGAAYVAPITSFTCKDLRSEFDGAALPLNMASAAGVLAIKLLDLLEHGNDKLFALFPNAERGRENYIKRQKQNLIFAKNSVLPHLEFREDRVSWKYMPGGRPEDVAHGSLVVRFLIELEDSQEIDFISNKLVRTYRQLFANSNEVGSVYSHLEPYLNNQGVDVRSIGHSKSLSALISWAPLIQKDCRIAKDLLKLSKLSLSGENLTLAQENINWYQQGCSSLDQKF
jgi:hypothetical protein